MADRIDAVLDHVAIAVSDWRHAETRWRAQLGGARITAGRNPVFSSRQLRFCGGGKLELLSPRSEGEDNFVRRFLDRFGSTIHHITFKVPDLHAALDTLAAGGLDAVDVDDAAEHWQEAFLRPSQIGGVVVQVASTPYSDADYAAFTGFEQETPGPDAATLHGPLLRHEDLEHAHAIWTLLGADIERTAYALRCRWPDSPLDVVIEQGAPPGPVALRMSGAGALPSAEGVGPAVLDRD